MLYGSVISAALFCYKSQLIFLFVIIISVLAFKVISAVRCHSLGDFNTCMKSFTKLTIFYLFIVPNEEWKVN